MLDVPMTAALSRYLDLQTARMKLTATNMAKQNVLGYARRTVTWTGGDTVTLTANGAGQNPRATVTAQRSSVLDAAVASTTAVSASANTVQSALETLQSVFAINSSGDESSGINSAMSSFFAAMQSIAADPSSSSARQAAFAAAQAVASSFQSTSATLLQQSADLDSTIANSVVSINQLSASIASLNQSITHAATPADRDALLDQRTAQIDSLSQLLGVQQMANSDGSVSLFTTSGGALVVGSQSNAVSTRNDGDVLQVYVQGANVTDGLQGGSVGGAIAARDGVLVDTAARIDALASAFANAVNSTNSNGRTQAGVAGAAVFTLDNSSVHPAVTMAVTATSGADFAAAGSGEGANGTSNASALAALADLKNTAGDTFAETLSSTISNIGTAAASAQNNAAAATSAATQASAKQEALSGVSLDTEAANLTQYQRSYQAEAKLLAVLNQIMTDAINLGTNTAVS